MIEADGLQKRYGEHVAVAGSTSRCPQGRILGVLGPNGAGKSTTVRMLTTMTHPDGGRARVGGFDVVTEADAGAPHHRRHRPGRHPRRAADRHARTCVLVGRAVEACRREAPSAGPPSCSSSFELTDAAGRMVKTYSGGMRRRLDLAASLIDPAAGAVPRRADHRARPDQPAAACGR